MKFGIKKTGDSYEWDLYERSTQKIVQEEIKLYFPLSRPQKNFENNVKLSPKNDTFLAILSIPDDSGYFSVLSYTLLNNLKEFIEKEEPLELNKKYNIDQFDQTLTLSKKEIIDEEEFEDFLESFKFFRETTLLEGDNKSTINVFISEDAMCVLFAQPNEKNDGGKK